MAFLSIICIYHLLLIRTSVDGRLSCFCVLAVVSNAAVKLGCMDLFELEFSLDICSRVGMLDHMVALFLVFKGSSVLKEVAAPIYIPTNSVGRFSSLHPEGWCFKLISRHGHD